MTKKKAFLYILGIIIFVVVYLSYPNKSDEMVGVGIAIIILFICNFVINKKIIREVKQYARENISCYKGEEGGSSGGTTRDFKGDTARAIQREHGNEESVSDEGHSDIQDEYLEIPKLNDKELPGIIKPSESNSDTVEEHSSAIPDLE